MVEIKIKRGEQSWNYFQITFFIVLTVILAIISFLNIKVLYKIILTILSVIILFRLCFFNNWLRNKIVGLMIKSKEKVEEYKY